MARPMKYKSAKALQSAIDKYFESCEGKPLMDENGRAVTDKHGQPVIVGARPPTVTGLALALGFASRQALINYQARPEFNDTIMRAKTRCEEYAEARLYDRDGSRGAEFSLKYNFRWGEQQQEKETANDGFMDALKGEAGEAWQDE